MSKAIIFDMDGVIADTEKAYMESFNKILEKFNIKINKNEWFQRFPGTGTTYTMSTVFKEHNFKPKEGLNYWLERWKKEYEKVITKEKIKPIESSQISLCSLYPRTSDNLNPLPRARA